jgi:hypothetical protein
MQMSNKLLIPLDPETRGWIDAAAAREERSRAAIVRRVLREARERELQAQTVNGEIMAVAGA